MQHCPWLFRLLCFCYRSRGLRDFHSFPTRRSSDLPVVAEEAVTDVGADDYELAMRLLEGRNIAKDPNQAIPLLERAARNGDRKSTRLNSSHVEISYAVFCLKKKKTCASINTHQILA